MKVLGINGTTVVKSALLLAIQNLSLAKCSRSALAAALIMLVYSDLSLSAAQTQPAGKTITSSRPEWAELNTVQKATLKPLATSWTSLSEPQKRKWIAIAQNYPRLPLSEQAKLQSNMQDWAGLNPVQRNQARQNFAETRQLSPAQKKDQWDAYLALSPQEKQRLALNAPAKPAGAAPVISVAPKANLAKVAPSRSDIKGKQLSRSHSAGKVPYALAPKNEPIAPQHP